MEESKPPWSKFWIINKAGRVINTHSVYNIASEGSEGMIQSDDFVGSLEAFKASNNQLLTELANAGLELLHTLAGEVRVKGLPPFAVEIMSDSRKMRSLEVDNTADETFISVRSTDRAGNVKFIIVFIVANRQLEWVNPDNGS